MDIARLSRGEKIAGVSAVVLFIFMFFDWFTVSVSGAGGAFSTGALGAGSAWDALDNIPIFLVFTILVVLAVVALRLSDSTYEPPISANAVVAVLGAISFLLILFRIVDTPGGGSFAGVSVDVSPTFGIFISLIAAAGIVYGGYEAMKEEGMSFGEVAERLGAGEAHRPPLRHRHMRPLLPRLRPRRQRRPRPHLRRQWRPPQVFRPAPAAAASAPATERRALGAGFAARRLLQDRAPGLQEKEV